jgi:hypothetical protein
VVSWGAFVVEREKLILRTQPRRWGLTTASMIALAVLAPFLGGIYLLVAVVGGLAALFRLAILFRVRLSARRGGEGRPSGRGS